jgi:general stress protein 26
MSNEENLKAKVLNFLHGNKLASLATASKSGEPHSTTVFFVADNDLNLYFITKSNTKKVNNISENNLVAMSIGQQPPIYIQLYGQAELISDVKTKNEKMNELARVSADMIEIWPPILRMLNEEEYLLYKIVPSSLQMLDLDKKFIAEEEYPFVKIV